MSPTLHKKGKLKVRGLRIAFAPALFAKAAETKGAALSARTAAIQMNLAQCSLCGEANVPISCLVHFHWSLPRVQHMRLKPHLKAAVKRRMTCWRRWTWRKNCSDRDDSYTDERRLALETAPHSPPQNLWNSRNVQHVRGKVEMFTRERWACGLEWASTSVVVAGEAQFKTCAISSCDTTPQSRANSVWFFR